MSPPVHVNGVEAVWAAVVENINTLEFRHVQDFEAIRGQPKAWARRRLAARIRLVLQKIDVTIID